MSTPPGDRSAPSPIYLLAGGPGSRRNPYRSIVADALRRSGKPEPLVAYVGAATDDDPRFAGMMQELIASAGPCTVRLAPVKGRGAARAAREVLDAADVVFLGGGDVELGMQRLTERDLRTTLLARKAAGVPYLGISAGAIMLANRWVRWRDPEDDASAESFACLGLAPLLCDCHGEGDGWGELKTLLRLSGDGAEGWGIRAGAALRVAADGRVEPACGALDVLRVRGGEVVAT